MVWICQSIIFGYISIFHRLKNQIMTDEKTKIKISKTLKLKF